jgi:hypothetical protein
MLFNRKREKTIPLEMIRIAHHYYSSGIQGQDKNIRKITCLFIFLHMVAVSALKIMPFTGCCRTM